MAVDDLGNAAGVPMLPPEGNYYPQGTWGNIAETSLGANTITINSEGYPVNTAGEIWAPLANVNEYPNRATGPLADRVMALLNEVAPIAQAETLAPFVRDAEGIPVRKNTAAQAAYQSLVAFMNAGAAGQLTEGNVAFIEKMVREEVLPQAAAGGAGGGAAGTGARPGGGGGMAGGVGGGVGGGGGTSGVGQGGTAAQRDALARLRQVAITYGLPDTLGDWMWDSLLKGKGEAEILNDLYDPANPGGKAFAARFPAIQKRRAAGLAPLSPGEYIAYERGYRQLMDQAQMPRDFYDSPEDVTSFLTNDVSLAEIGDRIQQGYVAVRSLPKDIRDEFTNLFGTSGDAALASFVLDRNRSLPALQKNIASAQAAGIGARYGVRISTETAMRLGDMGYTPDVLTGAFGKLKDIAPVFSERVGEMTNLEAAGAGVEALFSNSESAQRALTERIGQRANIAGTAGEAMGTSKGLFGLATTT